MTSASRTFETAIYTCYEGYELKGDKTRTCFGTNWQGYQSICIPIGSPVESSDLHNTEASSSAAEITSKLSSVQTSTETVPLTPIPTPSTTATQ
jgi:Sushi repeat (SCR repeat)